jgi:hypothetical protein
MNDRNDPPSPRLSNDRGRFAELHAVDKFLSSVAGKVVPGPAIVDLLTEPTTGPGRDFTGKEYWALAEATFFLRGWLVGGPSDAERVLGAMRPSEHRCHEEAHLAALLSRMEIACVVGDLYGISTSNGTYVRLPDVLEWADQPPFPARFFGDPQDFPMKDVVERFTPREESYEVIKEALAAANDRLEHIASGLKGRRAVKLEDWTRFLWALAKSIQNRGTGTRQYAADQIHKLLDVEDSDVNANAPTFDQLKQWIEDAEHELGLPLARPKTKKGE